MLQEGGLQVQKLLSTDASLTLWANNMDLLAITTFDHTLSLYRINFKIQKVFHIAQTQTITSLCFSPDSCLLAYGLSDGAVHTLRTKNGQKIVFPNEKLPELLSQHTSPINHLSFISFTTLDRFLPFQQDSIQSKLIGNINPHKNCNRSAIAKIKQFSELGNDFTLLSASQPDRTRLFLNGHMLMGQITYSQLPNYDILCTHLYPNSLQTILCCKSQSYTHLLLAQSLASPLWSSQQQLVKFTTIVTYITQLINFVQVTYDHAQILVRDICRQYNSKINLIDQVIVQGFTLPPCSQLYNHLRQGTITQPLSVFFSKEISEIKVLEKLDQALSAGFVQLQQLLLQSTQNSIERTTILLHRVQSLAQVQKYSHFKMELNTLEEIEQRLRKLYVMGQMLMVQSTEAKFDIKNLLVWLNKASLKCPGQNDMDFQNNKSYLSRYTVDFTRLHSFLQDQNKFTLQNLLVFFIKGSTGSIVPRPPQFKIYRPHPQKVSPTKHANGKKLLQQLQLDQMTVEKDQAMEHEQVYKAFTLQSKQLRERWGVFLSTSLQNTSKLLNAKYQRYEIAKIPTQQLMMVPAIKNNGLILYYVEKGLVHDKLFQYDCSSKSKRWLTSQMSIIHMAVAERVYAVFADRVSGSKVVAEIMNEEYNGEEVYLGNARTKFQGEIKVNCSMRGLFSVIKDRNKLTVYE